MLSKITVGHIVVQYEKVKICFQGCGCFNNVKYFFFKCLILGRGLYQVEGTSSKNDALFLTSQETFV